MLTYDMERRGALPLYDHLFRCIREDILAGRLGAGDKLPSKRALARHLQVSVSTVETAYAQLAAEGYVDPREKRGYFVCPVEAGPLPAPPPPPIPEEPEGEAWSLDLRSGGMGRDQFPFSVWARLMRRVLSEVGQDLLLPSPHSGVLPLRRAIADYLYRFRGIRVAPEQVVVGAGAEYLYGIVVQLLGRDRVFGVEDPGYHKPALVYRSSGVDCRPVPVDRQGLEVAALEELGVDVVHLSPSHHFPTGAVTPIARRQALLQWAARDPRRYIIEDDYDSEFRFTGRPIPTLQSIDRGDRVIYLNTFSRTLAPSLRIGYMVLPPALLRRYEERLGFYSCTVPSMEQYTLAAFLAQGHFERHINRMRTFYRARRDQVVAAIQAGPLGPRSTVLAKDAGLHFLLRLDTERTDEEIIRLAAGQGIRVSCLSEYCVHPRPEQSRTLVIRYAGVEPGLLSQALERLGQVL